MVGAAVSEVVGVPLFDCRYSSRDMVAGWCCTFCLVEGCIGGIGALACGPT